MSLLEKNYFTKPIIDYFLDELLKKKSLSEDEIYIILNSRKKYRKFILLNGLIFSFSIRQIYKNSCPHNFFNKLNVQTFRFCATSIVVMVYIYYIANNEYYIDNKFLIRKYFNVDEKQFNKSIINREIIKLYNIKKEII